MINMYNADIVLIDSGLNIYHPDIDIYDTEVIALQFNENLNTVELSSYLDDEVGHGTAVYSILRKTCPKANILVIKLLGDYGQIDSLFLQETLYFIYEHINCRVIHLSLGVEVCTHINDFEIICNKLYNKGVLIVSAFSNLGCVSYPAAFSTVFGVDESIYIKRIDEFEVVYNSIIDVQAASIIQNLPWGTGKRLTVSGTSFSSPYITGFLYDILSSQDKLDFTKLKDKLKAKVYIKCSDYSPVSSYNDFYKIKKAIAFPFNKEVHSLARYIDTLNFDLQKIYDVKHLGNVGKSTKKLLSYDSNKDIIIESIENIDWKSDFDTLILGHTETLSKGIGINYAEKLINKCNEYQKNVYSFDQIDRNIIKNAENIKIYTPSIEKENIPAHLMGKLYYISTPILCIIGTSSKQGKFTLQCELKSLFIKMGLKIGQLGTEPSSLLYGFDGVFPIGYNSTVHIHGMDTVKVINNMMHDIELKKPDLIITGTQSQTVPASIANISNVPYEQSYVLCGMNPDGFILVCNYFDDDDYIIRTIYHAESYSNAKVIGIVMYPIDRDFKWTQIGINNRRFVPIYDLMKRKSELSIITNKKIFILGYENDMQNLADECIAYYTN